MFWNINLAAAEPVLRRMGGVLRSNLACVVGLSEISWAPTEFAHRAATWGYPHSLLLKTDRAHRFNIGLMSTERMLPAAKTTAKPFFHGALCATLPARDHAVVCVTHLTPHLPSARLAEAHALLRLLDQAVLSARTEAARSRAPDATPAEESSVASWPVLLLGDLNALSSRDAAEHAASGLAARLLASKSASKFAADGTGVAPSVNGYRIDYGVLSALTRDALVDLLPNGSLLPTVPTPKRSGDPRHVAPMRLDYALGSRALLARCPHAEARVLREAEAGELSDHWPLRVTLCWTAPVAVWTAPGATVEELEPARWTTAEAEPAPRSATVESVVVRAAKDAPAEHAITGSLATSGGRSPSCTSRSLYAPLLSAERLAECRELSGMAAALAGHRRAHGRPELRPRATLGRCAVVGSSGALLWERRGAEIDNHDVILRLNKAPVRTFEASVGSSTTVRLMNAPQSQAWAQELRATSEAAAPRADAANTDTAQPPDTVRLPEMARLPEAVQPGELLLLSTSTDAWVPLAPAVLGVARLNRTYRKRCVAPWFTEEDQAAHRRRHHNRLTPTFGFEAVVHALHACDTIDAYGFYIPPSELEGNDDDGAEARALASAPSPSGPFRYHYWEAHTRDPAADKPSKPWTYKSHNYEIEGARLRHMASHGCVLRLHMPGEE